MSFDPPGLARPRRTASPGRSRPATLEAEQARILALLTEAEAGRRRAEGAEARLRAMLDNAVEFIGLLAPDGTLLEANRAALEFGGFPAEAVIGRPFWEAPWWAAAPDPRTLGRLRAAIAEAAAGIPARFEVEVRGAARTAVIDFSLTPVRDPDGTVTLLVPEGRDVTGRRRAERQRELLVQELNHRVKNTLVTVQSIATQTLRGDALAGQRRAFQDRLIALAAAHDILTRERWEGAALREVVEAALRPHAGWDVAGRVATAGPDARLSPRAAVAISMALHELSTNALKYGALSVEAGRVELDWQVADGRLRLSWREAGGPAVSPPARRGFGSRLLERGLPHDLAAEARLDFTPAGVAFLLDMPLPDVPGR